MPNTRSTHTLPAVNSRAKLTRATMQQTVSTGEAPTITPKIRKSTTASRASVSRLSLMAYNSFFRGGSGMR